jgi:Tol biopolymer transport system component
MDYSGRKLVFESDVALEAGTPSDGQRHVYLFDLDSGITTRLTETVAAGQDGAAGDGDSTAPVISGDGSTVAFVSAADNLDQAGTQASAMRQVYVAALEGRRVTRMRRASRAAGGSLGSQDSQRVALDYGGRRLGYDSLSENLSAGALTNRFHVFAQDNPLNPERLFRAGFE